MSRVRTWSIPVVVATVIAGIASGITPAAGAPARVAPVQAAPADTSAPGPYAVGFVDSTVSASGRSFSARIYYPATSAGSSTPTAAGQFPAVAFGHGFFQAVSKYATTGTQLASWGIITLLPTSQGGLAPSHSGFADDLNAALTWIVAQQTTAGSRFAGHVRTDRLGLSGHSMGGGASILAAARNPAVRTVANLAAAETNPSAVSAAATLTIPVQFVAGSADTIAPPASHQRLMYNAKPAPVQIRTITGGFHCGFIDSSGIGCDSGAITRDVQLKLTRKLLTSWFLYYLNDDASQQSVVWGDAAHSDPQVTFEGRN